MNRPRISHREPLLATDSVGPIDHAVTYGLGDAATYRANQHWLHSHAPTENSHGTGTGVGLWIDHRKAVIVFVAMDGVTTVLILSRADRQPSRTDGRRSPAPAGHHQAPALDHRDRHFRGQLEVYYSAVIACLRPARFIMAFGPGEARGELRRRLALNKHDRRVFVFEVADKMTSRQIAAKTMTWLETGCLEPPPPRRRSGRPPRCCVSAA